MAKKDMSKFNFKRLFFLQKKIRREKIRREKNLGKQMFGYKQNSAKKYLDNIFFQFFLLHELAYCA